MVCYKLAEFDEVLSILLVCYTGSQRVAKIIGVAAAKTLSPVTLEVRYITTYGIFSLTNYSI